MRWTDPPDAVTVMLAVVGCVWAEDPQALRPIRAVTDTMMARPLKYLRRRMMHASRVQRTMLPPPTGHRREAVLDAAMVIVVLVVGAIGVTVAGAKVQVAPAGRPEQPKVTVPLKPPRAVNVMVSVPVDPRGTLSVAVPAAIWKSEFVNAKVAVEVPFVAVAVTLYAPAVLVAVAATVAMPEALVVAVAAESVALAPLAGAA